MTRPDHGRLAPGGTTDTAGAPWAGRVLGAAPFAGDDGAGDPALMRVLQAHAAGKVEAADVVAALAGRRLLVPVVALPGEDHPLPGGMRGDLGAQMAVAILTASDGRRAVPAFTSTQSLISWAPAARPVPVEAARAAQAAVAEGCVELVLDVAGPVTFVVSRPALWALAQGRSWVPSPRDALVHAAVESACRSVAQVRRVHCEPGVRAELRVVLGVVEGLDRAGLDAVLEGVRAGLSGQEVVADRVGSVELVVVSA